MRIDFYKLGMEIINDTSRIPEDDMRKFKAHFGVSPIVLSQCWKLLLPEIVADYKAQPKHLLWACMFMKLYPTESVLSSRLNCTEKSLRKWIWIIIRAIGDNLPFVVSELYSNK